MSLHTFIVENSLYDPADPKSKSDFLTDANIADAFVVNFIGLVGLVNLGSTAQLKSFINSIGPKVRYDNIDETNDDVSLSVKLFADAGGFMSVATRDSFTRLLAKIKTHTVTTVDETQFRKMLQDCKFNVVKPSLLLQRTVKDFIDGTIGLNELVETIYVNKNNARWSHIIEEIRPAFIAAKTLIKVHRTNIKAATTVDPVSVPTTRGKDITPPHVDTSHTKPTPVAPSPEPPKPKVPEYSDRVNIDFVKKLIRAHRLYFRFGTFAEDALQDRLLTHSSDDILEIVSKFKSQAMGELTPVYESGDVSDLYYTLNPSRINDSDFPPVWAKFRVFFDELFFDPLLNVLKMFFNNQHAKIDTVLMDQIINLDKDNLIILRMFKLYENNGLIEKVFESPLSMQMINYLSTVSSDHIHELEIMKEHISKMVERNVLLTSALMMNADTLLKFKDKWVGTGHPFIAMIEQQRISRTSPIDIFKMIKDFIETNQPNFDKYFSLMLQYISDEHLNVVLKIIEDNQESKIIDIVANGIHDSIVAGIKIKFIPSVTSIFPTKVGFLLAKSHNLLYQLDKLFELSVLNSISDVDALKMCLLNDSLQDMNEKDYFNVVYENKMHESYAIKNAGVFETSNKIFRTISNLNYPNRAFKSIVDVSEELTRIIISDAEGFILNNFQGTNHFAFISKIDIPDEALELIKQYDEKEIITNNPKIRVIFKLKLTKDEATKLWEEDNAIISKNPNIVALPLPPLDELMADAELFTPELLKQINDGSMQYKWFSKEFGMSDNQKTRLTKLVMNTNSNQYLKIKSWLFNDPQIVFDALGEDKFFDALKTRYDIKDGSSVRVSVLKLLEDTDDNSLSMKYLSKIKDYIIPIFRDDETPLIDDELLFSMAGTPMFDEIYKLAGRKAKIRMTKFKKLLKVIDHLYEPDTPIIPAKRLSGAALKKALKFNNITIDAVMTDGIAEQKAEKVDRSREHFEKVEGEWYVNNWNNLHGRTGVKLLEEFVISLPHQAYDEFRAKFNNTMSPVWHGCPDIAAAMITRYGFKVIPFDSTSMAGRALGNGIYFTNIVPKMLQYVRPNKEINRAPGVRGYIFELDTILGSRQDYSAAGGHISGRFLSAEWCVFHPHAQLKFIKVYHAEIADVSHNKNMAIKHNLLKEDYMASSFKEFLKEEVEEKPVHIAYFNFMDGMIVNSDLSVVPWTEFDTEKYGAEIHPAQNGIIVAKECEEKYAGFYVFPTAYGTPLGEEFGSWNEVMFS